MTLEAIHGRRQVGRKITGMAAVLLPFEYDGRFAEVAYQECFRETLEAGLTPAVNMDRGT